MIEVIYAGGLRVSELVALTWSDVLPRDERVQLNHRRQGRQGAPGIVARGRQPQPTVAAGRRRRQ